MSQLNFFYPGSRFTIRIFRVALCLSVLFFSRCTKKDFDGNSEGNEENSIEAFLVSHIFITTENTEDVTSKDEYVNCSIKIDSDKNNWNYSGTGRIRGRGNSTWLWYPKKPYRIKLDEKNEILGLPADKDWVLLADYRDPTHLMNTFVFTVGQGLGFPYVNHCRYVELTLNNEYLGLYSLTEQVEQGKNRVAVDSENGLLLSLDADDGPDLAPNEEDNFWSSVYRMPICVKDPDIFSPTQLAAIRNEFALLENAIYNGNYGEVEKLLDVPSFIDYMIIQELVYNVEVAAPRSIYMYKDENSRWAMGPLWDFDAGYDFEWSTMYTGHNYFQSYKKLVLGTDPGNHIGGYVVSSFFTDLFKNKQFVSEYKTRWLAVKDLIMSEYWETAQKYADNFSDAMTRDFERWPIDKDNETEILRMKQWLTNRIDYLNIVIGNYPEGVK